MVMRTATEQQILDALHELAPHFWPEVLDFMAFLQYRESRERTQLQPQKLTARDLLQSDLVGLWSDRTDIEDSVEFARQLRRQAEHQRGHLHDLG